MQPGMFGQAPQVQIGGQRILFVPVQVAAQPEPLELSENATQVLIWTFIIVYFTALTRFV